MQLVSIKTLNLCCCSTLNTGRVAPNLKEKLYVDEEPPVRWIPAA